MNKKKKKIKKINKNDMNKTNSIGKLYDVQEWLMLSIIVIG